MYQFSKWDPTLGTSGMLGMCAPNAGIYLRRLGCGFGRRLVADSCYPRDDRAEWVVRGLGRAFLYLSIYLFIYLGHNVPPKKSMYLISPGTIVRG